MRNSYMHYESRAIVEIDPNIGGGGYVISRVNTPLPSRGKGHAGRLMAKALADADAEGVTLWLDINPYGSMNYAELASWYGRLGFRKHRNGRYRRLPQTGSQ